MVFHITYYGKTGVQFASDLINHEHKQIHSFEQIQEKLDETVKLGETDTGGQVSVTQVGPKNFNGTKFQRRKR
jgi:hypothetical protein